MGLILGYKDGRELEVLMAKRLGRFNKISEMKKPRSQNFARQYKRARSLCIQIIITAPMKERNYPIFFSSFLNKLPTPFSSCPALASNFPFGGFAALAL